MGAVTQAVLLRPATRGVTSGDGVALLQVAAACLLASGVVAIVLGLTTVVLPHDLAWAGLDGAAVRDLAGGRVLAFMAHDRIAFGGAVVAVAMLHLWLLGPGREEGGWAWLTLAISSVAGFASFLAFVAYGYLDPLHAAATLGILPGYAVGLLRSLPAWPAGAWHRGWSIGRCLLVLAALGLVGGGLGVLGVGSTVVFVPQDVAWLGVEPGALAGTSERLVALIAHDRAGFGGAVLSTGIATLGIAALGRPGRSRTLALGGAGVAGFGTAIGVHVLVGYLDPVHLAPAVVGAALYTAGLVLERSCGTPATRGQPRDRATAPAPPR